MDTSGSSTSRSLVARLKSRDEHAWERLVALYGPLIYHWCRKCGLSPEDSADTTQDTFGRVSSSIASFRRQREGDTFRGWLWTITRNLVRDHTRSDQGVHAAGGTEMQQALSSLVDDDLPPDENSPNSPMADVVQRAMDAVRNDFNDQTWQAFQLTVFQNHNATQAAEKIGMTPAAVRKAKSRVLQRLREELGDL